MTWKTSLRWASCLVAVSCLQLLPGVLAHDKDDKDKDAGKVRKHMTFRAMDRNNDGKITLSEWRGSERSFHIHDGNRDGVLTSREVEAAYDDENYDDFADLDRDRDGVISSSEWRWSDREFDYLDDNDNGVLSRREYEDSYAMGDPGYPRFPAEPGAPGRMSGRDARFEDLDRNDNGQISRTEWDGQRDRFDALDDNDDGVLSRAEFIDRNGTGRRGVFRDLDRNGNGEISLSEWRGDRRAFDKLDINDDKELTREEFDWSYRALEDDFERLDRDDDGVLERSEWRRNDRAFERLDEDRDGEITFEEFAGFRR